jgi:glycosyltransferase involved in cell wall biosynthesis
MKKVLVIYNPNIGGCASYRLLYPYNELKKSGIEIDFANILEDFTQDEIKKYDIVVFHMNFVKIEQIKYLQSIGIKTIVDFDDYWIVPNTHFSYKEYVQNNLSSKLIGILKSANYITTTTKTLAKQIKNHNKNVIVFPNSIPLNLPQFIQTKETENKDTIRFGYMGGRGHRQDLKELEMVLPELAANVVSNNKEGKATLKHIFYLFGFDAKDRVKMAYADIVTHYGKYLENFRGIEPVSVLQFPLYYNDIDVSLVPLEKDMFNSCKSELKIVEAGAFSKTVICSNVAPYKYHIKHMENGLLANNPKQFAILAKYCINNPGHVKEMGLRLNSYVKSNFNFIKITENRYDFLNEL